MGSFQIDMVVIRNDCENIDVSKLNYIENIIIKNLKKFIKIVPINSERSELTIGTIFLYKTKI